MSREKLAELRPEIPSALLDNTKSIEHFQNEVLRPIIKFQHDFIVAYFEQNTTFQSLRKENKTLGDFLVKVQAFIGNQPNIKHQLIGSIIGMLTHSELETYWSDSTAHNKRIHQMICQRVADTFFAD